MSKGYLVVELFVGNQVLPVGGRAVIIRDRNGNILHRLTTDENGHTSKVTLDCPPKRDTYEPSGTPFFEPYDVEVPSSGGYKRVIIHDVEIFEGITTICPVEMHPAIIGTPPAENTDEIFIPLEHGVDMRNARNQSWTDSYENEAVSIEQIMANEVKIPDYITVHLGSPNATARNVTVPFKEYIKNVASSEIFPTWHESALYANIYAQISFALNRIYTVWYPSRGKNFDITNSTAFDQFFVEGRDIFENIARIVDRIFNNFVRRQGRREPFFTIYCNGTTATCDGLSQWGSQDLAMRGYTPIQILRYYYPNDVQIVESTNFSTNINVYPGTSLKEGDSGEKVRLMQRYLGRISGNWYITPIAADGFFGSATKNTVMEFQRLFNLPADGIIGKSTWYEIVRIYVAATELAELTSEGERISVGANPPTVTVQLNSRGPYVVELQFLLNFIGQFFHTIPPVIQSSIFRDDTKRAVVEFQKTFGLTPDGIVGPGTWSKLYDVYHSIGQTVPIPPPSSSIPPFPGTALRVGSRGDDVLLMQNYLNAIGKHYPAIPALSADGVFGPLTETAVRAFQRQFGLTVDGVIGQQTWYTIVDVYNGLPTSGGSQYPGTPLRIGSRGSDVTLMQNYLNSIRSVFPVIPAITVDGVFGTRTEAAVIAFQRLFGLTPDGVIGRNTWDKIVYVYNNKPNVAAPTYPGTALRIGSRGNNVTLMQKYLNTIRTQYPSIPAVTADGIFGPATEAAVMAFQRIMGLAADGVIGLNTWNSIVSSYNLILMSAGDAYSVSAYSTGFSYTEQNPYENFMRMMMFRRFFW